MLIETNLSAISGGGYWALRGQLALADAPPIVAKTQGKRWIMNTPGDVECCPKFEPNLWDNKTVTWDKKLFLKDRVRSFFHIPLNFGAVRKRSLAAIQAAGAVAEERIVLCDENSLWGADVYVAIAKEIPGRRLATLSGTYLAKVFEGPYRNARNWIIEMHDLVKSKEQIADKLYFYYTTCPKCAQKYGKNYVVILAQVSLNSESLDTEWG